MDQPVWYSGVCDSVLRKVDYWVRHYEDGELAATRQFLDPKVGVIDKPTKYAVTIPWKLVELKHLIRINTTLRPGTPLTEEIQRLEKIWKHGTLLPGGSRVMTLIFYPEHVKELRSILLEAKSGQKAASLEEIMRKKQAEGKDLFEL